MIDTKKAIIAFLLLFVPCQAWAAAITSAQDGPWNSSSTWVGGTIPGDGDSATIATGHDVAVESTVTVGTSGASGTAALIVNQGGSLAVNAPLRLKGGLHQQKGAALTGSNNGSTTSGSITFTPPSGSTYKWVFLSSGTGASPITLTGTASSKFEVTTTQGGGGNAWIDANTTSHSVTLSHVKMSRFGDDTNQAINFTQGWLDDHVQVTDTIFDYCGQIRFDWISGANAANIIFNNVDIRNTLESGASSVPSLRLYSTTAKTSGTRSVSNLTIYNGDSSPRYAYTAVVDLTLENIFSHNVSWTSIGNSNAAASKLFFTSDIGMSSIITTQGKNNITISNSAFLSHNINPHFVTESSTAGSLTANIYSNNVFDGDGYYDSDAGDLFILPAATGSQITKNISINKAGTLVTTMGASVAVAANLNGNTMYGSYGAAIGETTGGAAHISTFKNNLTVAQSDGIHKQTAFVPQSSFALNNNAWYNMTDVDYTWSASNYGYMASVYANRVGSTTTTTGTDSTHVVATGSPFTNVIVGDFVTCGSKGIARVSAKTDANNLTLDRAISGMVSGDSVTVQYNWWDTSGQYWGDGTRGAGDVNVDPSFADPTRTVRGYGSWASVQAAAREMATVNGTAYDGSSTTATTKTVTGMLTYIRDGFTPRNMDLLTAGEGGTYIGAVEPKLSYSGAALSMGM